MRIEKRGTKKRKKERIANGFGEGRKKRGENVMLKLLLSFVRLQGVSETHRTLGRNITHLCGSSKELVASLASHLR